MKELKSLGSAWLRGQVPLPLARTVVIGAECPARQRSERVMLGESGPLETCPYPSPNEEILPMPPANQVQRD